MSNIFLSKLAESELRDFDPDDRKQVARVISLLEDESFRSYNKMDLILIEDGYDVWSICVGIIWLAYIEDVANIVKVVHISLLSRFRAPS